MDWLASCLLLLVACGSSKPAVEPVAPPPPKVAASPQVHAVADAIAHAYELLAIYSAAPGNRPKMAAAVLAALAPPAWHAPMVNWTDDPHQDAQTLRALVIGMSNSGLLPGDAVLRATHGMAAASGDLSTFALGRAAVTALSAQLTGTPSVQVGMTYHRAADGRWAASSVIARGPAAKAGVHRGDVLVSIDGRPIERGYIDFAPLLGAPVGTTAALVIERGGKTQQLELRLGIVEPPIVDTKVLGTIGYVRVWSCTHSDAKLYDAGALVAKALAVLDARHARALVLDLRGNPGGFPLDIASLLVEDDPLLVAIDAKKNEQPIARTAVAAWKTKRPIAVLVDDETASGAEWLALVLRDYASATIVGRPTAGALTLTTVEMIAGDVTLSYPISRIASAKTKLPIDGNRLTPDVEVANPSAVDFASSRDPQLDAALTALATK